MSFMVQVITHTPPYIWLLLAYLVWQGVQALRPRTTSLTRALVLPALFIVSGVLPLIVGSHLEGELLLPWMAGVALLAPVGLVTGPRVLSVDRANSRITRDGSLVPLCRNLIVFVLQYGIAVAIAIHADHGRWLILVGKGISGATAGYFIGWAVTVCRRYFDASVD